MTGAPGQGERLPASLWVLLGCQAALVAGLALSFPFFAIYLSRDRGLPMGAVGAALSAMMATTAVAHGLGGELSDLHGSKVVMESALVARGVLAAALAWAVSVRAPVPLLVALLVLAGFAGTSSIPGSARGSPSASRRSGGLSSTATSAWRSTSAGASARRSAA